jgi:aspartate/methionine/tyrosine aminotransferase
MTALEIDPFYAIHISRQAHALKAQGRRILHMEFGQPATGAPPAALARAHLVLDSDAMGYWESNPLTTRIAKHYRDVYGVPLDPEAIILTAGASPALIVALLSLFRPGARVAIARPGYVAYRNSLRALGMQPVEIACGMQARFQLSAQAIAALDPAPEGVLIASPANPTGTMLDAHALRDIVALCEARGIRLISDEIYHGLSYGARAHSVLEFSDKPFVINSFSKYYSMAGWRLGWAVAPKDTLALARAIVGNLFLTAPSLAQHAGLEALESSAVLDAHIDVYRANRALLLDALPALGLSAIAPPDGAFYLYIDVGHLTQDSLAFCFKLLNETGIAIAPGIDFDPVEGHHFVRISFALSTQDVAEAVAILKDWLPQQPLTLNA